MAIYIYHQMNGFNDNLKVSTLKNMYLIWHPARATWVSWVREFLCMCLDMHVCKKQVRTPCYY